jgi:hypothetical protein
MINKLYKSKHIDKNTEVVTSIFNSPIIKDVAMRNGLVLKETEFI